LQNSVGSTVTCRSSVKSSSNCRPINATH
jgi:hypothetical protein